MTTQSKKKTVPSVQSSVISRKRVENSWILIIKDTLFENDNFSIITLPHPGHGHATKYCLDDAHTKLYEVITFSEPYRSWFIGETVKSDGSLKMLTLINPLFLVLPRLREQCAARAIPLEHLLSERGYDKILDFVTNLDNIADLKGPPEMRAYKYNEEKTLTWLENKIRKLAQVLREKKVHVTSGSISASFVASNVNNESVDEEFYLKYAHGMVSEYLQEDLAELLEKRFNFKPELVQSVGKKKRQSEIEDPNDISKRMKFDPSENGTIYNTNTVSEIIKQKPLTAKEKARQKAASGTKTLSAFFTKK